MSIIHGVNRKRAQMLARRLGSAVLTSNAVRRLKRSHDVTSLRDYDLKRDLTLATLYDYDCCSGTYLWLLDRYCQDLKEGVYDEVKTTRYLWRGAHSAHKALVHFKQVMCPEADPVLAKYMNDQIDQCYSSLDELRGLDSVWERDLQFRVKFHNNKWLTQDL